MQPLKVLSLFSGIGAFERALENLKVPHEIIGFCEIDKWAIKAYQLIHNCDKYLGSVTDLDCSNLNADLITYGFPCQDISAAGAMKGLEQGTGTRSSLVWHALDIIEKVRPKYAICENVKMLVSKKFKKQFDIILNKLEQLGYTNYYQVLNAKDYNTPQNRERVFIVSVLNNESFEFPKPVPLDNYLQDLILPYVDEKYFLSDEQVEKIESSKFNQRKNRIIKSIICPCLLRTDNKGREKCINLSMEPFKYSISNLLEMSHLINHPSSYRLISIKGVSYCLTSGQSGNTKPYIHTTQKIRRLTPLEYWLLMGFNKSDVDLLRAHKFSDCTLYGLAGNSICVSVLEAIFKELFKGKLCD